MLWRFQWWKIVVFLIFIYCTHIYPTKQITKYKSEFDKTNKLKANGLNYKAPNLIVLPEDVDRCTNGRYMGSENIFQNCNAVCQSNIVRYRFIEPNETLVNIDGERLKPGAWCLPTYFHTCNTNVSSVIRTDGNNWLCEPKYSLFGSINGNQILKCNGRIKDNRTNKIYQDFLPDDFQLTTLDETVEVQSGDKTIVKFAIECATQKDVNGNVLVNPQLGDRFDLVRNYCTKYITNADPTILPDFINHTCNCTNPNSQNPFPLENIWDNQNRTCIPCKSKQMETPCYGNKILVDEMDAEEIVMTCGVEEFNDRKIGCFKVENLKIL